VLSTGSGDVVLKGGESGATSGTRVAEGVGWWRVRMGLSVLIVLPDADDDDSGMERGDGVRGGLEMDVRGWKKFGWVVNAGMSLERRRPRTEAGEVEDGAGVGIGICNSGGGSCRPII
jgi:hypothetical protein